MKITPKTLFVSLVTCTALFAAADIGFAQATLSVSPSVISNNYAGVITLRIGGLTNGESVRVLTYLDLNSNGAVDAGEPLIDAFKIIDNGTNALFGGVTNVNIPADVNATNGAITTTISIAAPLAVANAVGQHIYRVVSPTGRFSPVTAALQITNATTGQSVSGTVFNGTNAFSNAVVVALLQPNTDYSAAAVADNTGHYSLNLNPGTYVLIATSPNCYTDQSLAPQVTLTNGAAATTNLSLTTGSVSNTIAGQVYDSVSSNGVAGVFLQFQSGNLLGIAFTDTNGGYSTTLTPSFWKIKAPKERLARRAYVASQNAFQVNATAGSVTNANFAIYPASALFYGRITDNSNAPLANVIFDSADMNNQFGAKGYSDANGNFAVAVLGSTNDDWSCSANFSGALTNYVLNTFNNTNLAVGQTVQENFVALPVTAHITGQLRDNMGNPVAGVDINANTFNGGYQALNSNTDGSGNYSLGVTSGSWVVDFSNGGEGGLDTHGFADLTGPHSVSIPPTNAVLNITVYPVGTPLISQPQRLSSTQFGFDVSGSVGVTYALQVSTNLAATNWSSLFSFQLTNNPFPLVDLNATNSPRFYRVKKGP